ncbi:MAG: hypothetical protein PHX43_00150 [Alphaproteobacteria bacterium]|nr:hypothetical protein [Alphaproteobacteria bacterium]
MQKILVTASIIGLMSLTACGETTVERSLSGAGIGAGVGTIGSLAVGGAVWPGMIAGAAVGAATGAITDTQQINLGNPIWDKQSSSN